MKKLDKEASEKAAKLADSVLKNSYGLKSVYIAHPFTSHGSFEENLAAQEVICKLYEGSNFVPVSPILNFGRVLDPSPGEAYERAMAFCVKLMRSCDEIHLYGEYGKSVGCNMEIQIARKLGMKIVHMVNIDFILNYKIENLWHLVGNHNPRVEGPFSDKVTKPSWARL